MKPYLTITAISAIALSACAKPTPICNREAQAWDKFGTVEDICETPDRVPFYLRPPNDISPREFNRRDDDDDDNEGLVLGNIEENSEETTEDDEQNSVVLSEQENEGSDESGSTTEQDDQSGENGDETTETKDIPAQIEEASTAEFSA